MSAKKNIGHEKYGVCHYSRLPVTGKLMLVADGPSDGVKINIVIEEGGLCTSRDHHASMFSSMEVG